ncbi:trihelix transcription factor ASIL2-like [Malania oleifera]|uniref:trihelix transcription factor ASIL2-like n=1 Tax=Malania oleifera TaxID=397392 RepID=UPI0025ADA30A|nr:trihelix transcription factor ASIL2-like [Malania oleifera]
MDDTEDDARYPPNPYGVNNQQGYGSTQRPKLPVRNIPYSQPIGNQYVDDDDDDDDGGDGDDDDEEEVDEEEDDDNIENDNVQPMGKNKDEDEDDDDDNDDDEDEDDEGKNYYRKTDNVDLERHPKKRKLKNLISSYEFAPRVAASSVAAASAPKPSFGGRNSLTDWTEHETFVLLDAWGDKFLQLGRKSLRSEEWQEVAEKVSQESKIERTDTQCRNRLDTLKKKYKKEKMKLAETGGGASKWVYFKKMDMLMSSSSRQAGLSCGLDSGEYVFMNPKVYLNRANVLDEMRDSPGNSESTTDEEDDSDGLPPKRPRSRRKSDEGSSFRLLADSIQKFSEIYEKIENSKRQQMVELEKMRMDFHRDLELQKRQILERARTEIAKIRQGDEENDVSAENISG